MTKISVLAMLCAVFLWTTPAFSQQGQWGGFIYLVPKNGVTLSADKKESIAKALHHEAGDFSNDFSPEKGKVETIQFYKSSEAPGEKPNSAAGLIRVESMKKTKVDGYHKAVVHAVKDFFDVEYRIAVTAELDYTDAATLDQLKARAPTRGNGKDQPNAVVLPIAKTPAWWALPLDKRKQYMDKHPETFGKDHVGHNEIGFVYIKNIFRKLYHSRFIDDQQDFMTYFEFSDNDMDNYNNLLKNLRDKQINPEWEYVQERPIFYGKRKASIEEIL